MITTILLILLLSLWLNRRPSGYLYCGIFAWTGDSVKKFSWDKFNILGIFNDERGGDSCGRVVGNSRLVGVSKGSKHYGNLIQIYNNEVVKEPIVIGHTRKASPGYAINEANSQPVVIEEDGEIVFVLAHNGTIHNTDELKKKYPVQAGASETDSYILAKIIYRYGFDVLAHYIGGAALVMYDRREYLNSGDTVMYLFKGESKASKWAKTTPTEERPLNIYVKPNNSMYISSEEDPLWAIGGDKDTVVDIDANTVFTIRNGELRFDESIEINREEAFQQKPYSSGYGYGMYDDWGYGGGNDFYTDGFSQDVVHNALERQNSSNNSSSKNSPHQIHDEELLEYEKTVTFIIFRKGLYYYKGLPANGILHIDIDREVTLTPIEGKTKPFYFIDGVMIKDHKSFREANISYANLSTIDKKGMRGSAILLKHSKYPLWIKSSNSGLVRTYSKSGDLGYYTGKLAPMFSRAHYVVSNGTVTTYSKIPLDEMIYPKELVKLSVSEDSYEEPFDENIMAAKAEITHTLVDLVQKIEDAEQEIEIIGQGALDTNPILENLKKLKGAILEDDNIFTKYIKLNETWESEEC